ncbi:hypothetical protein FLJC2902T_02380 [Flavobacterium limnosediminis JC2902]|uniref:Uncharacterized protein n=1 Tax=Flavobacterium limnosediminis JC2902 TaxID=1341181 RepID=V6SUB3_9FLAO|nr:hypothetical protein FLJC2902T_02380 [Flavobacterium limnosediminis JC2902]
MKQNLFHFFKYKILKQQLFQNNKKCFFETYLDCSLKLFEISPNLVIV